MPGYTLAESGSRVLLRTLCRCYSASPRSPANFQLGIFRETAAQHFHFPGSTTGSYEGRIPDQTGGCSRGPAIPGARQRALTDLVPSRFNAIVVETLFAATRDRGDMHMGKNGDGALDCSHFCFNPLFWQGIFSNLHAVLGRWAAADHGKRDVKPGGAATSPIVDAIPFSTRTT